MNHTTRRVRRLAASVTFAALAGGLALPLLATPAGAVQDTETRRLQGDDRYETAAAIATDTFPDGATSVVVATGEKFADALAANGLAGALGAPVLLTSQASLSPATAAALADLGAEEVFLMGGTSAVSQAVEDELAEDYTVERVEGDDRFQTAAAAAAAIAATDDGNPLTTADGLGETEDGLTAVLAFGLGFPDAVSGGAAAYAGRLPVLLTDTDTVPEATMTALEEQGIEHVLIVGGTSVVSNAVKTSLESEGYTTERLAGNDRWATNAAVNEYAEADDVLAFGGPTAYLSTGSKFADALTGGPAAGANDAPLVLTATASLPAPTNQYLAANANAIDEIVALGGTAAITDEVVNAAALAAQVQGNDIFDVTPTEDETRQVSTNGLNSSGARTYEVSGLEAGAEYVIALLDAESVEVGDPDRFSSYSLSDEASTSIESVNGSQVGAAGGAETVEETATAEDDGTITFVVDATAFDEIVPVVYEDLDADGELTITQGGSDEPYGLGGQTTWVPEEAASSTSTNTYDNIEAAVTRPDDGFFIANVVVDEDPVTGDPVRGDRTFYFDDTDRFRLLGVSTTPSVFESRLTPGDILDVEYQRDLQSRFDIVTNNGLQVVGLEEGVTVATNAGLNELNGGDVWMLHFSADVNISPSASISVRGPDSRGRFSTLQLTNGTSTSSWAVDGNTITIDIGRGVDTGEMFYGDTTTVVDLTGVTRAADGAAVTEAALQADRVLEDDGPELMPATSTCKVGDTDCTIEFNEPVNRSDGNDRDRYTYEPSTGADPTTRLFSTSVGADGRTVTFTFTGRIGQGDMIRPFGTDGGVRDDDSTNPEASDQLPFGFVTG